MILLLIMDAWAYFSMNKFSNSTVMFGENMLQFDLINRLQLAIEKMLIPPKDYLIHGNPVERENFNTRYTQVEGMFASLERINLTEEEKNTLKETKILCSEIKEKALEVLNLESPTIGKILLTKPMEQIDALAKNLVKKVDVLNQNAYETTTEAILKTKISTHDATRGLFYCASIILVIVFVTGFFILHSITKPIKLLQEGTELISHGKLDHRVNLRSHD